jgi:hypothetical protein
LGCLIWGNTSFNEAGGSSSSVLYNCTVTENYAALFTGGVLFTTNTASNCVIWNNTRDVGILNNYNSGTLNYCCTSPLPAGEGNIAADPQLQADAMRPSAASPTRGAGNTAYATGADVDGQPWPARQRWM